MPPRGADDAELELAGGDTLDDRVRVRDAEEDAHVRMFTMELAEEYRNDDRRRPGGRPQDEIAGELSFRRGRNVRDELLLERQHPLSSSIEPSPGLGRLHPSARAVEQLRSEPLLESSYLQRHRRLGHAEALRCLREAPPLDYRTECRELTRVHKESLSE